MPIIANKIVIVGKTEPVPTLKHEEKVQVRVSAPPVVTITSDNAIIEDASDFLAEKPSPYVSHMSKVHR